MEELEAEIRKHKNAYQTLEAHVIIREKEERRYFALHQHYSTLHQERKNEVLEAKAYRDDDKAKVEEATQLKRSWDSACEEERAKRHKS